MNSKHQIPNYNHKQAEKKWQKIWEEKQSFYFDKNSNKPKYYTLEMFPFPSGKIHMGHLRNYAIGDVIARFQKMQGFNVLHPIGFDAFGLPAENAALQNKIHPKDWTYSNIENMEKELKSIGFSYDWSRKFATCDEEYYKHEQKIFLDFLKNGLAYQKESFVNWDPIDKTVLANEQVIDGRGWRSGALVEKKKLKQWFLKVSDFSEELLQELKNLKGWDERVLSMQEKWIGKSQGAKIDFEIDFSQDDQNLNITKIPVYTTRPDTIFGAAAIVIAPNHPLSNDLAQNNQDIADFITKTNKNSTNQEALDNAEKEGINTGLEVIHPFDKNIKLPIYIGNFVLMEYGTGAIFACPAHDARDFEFAKKYNLPITQVVSKDGVQENLTEAFTDSGIMLNSSFLNGIKNSEAKQAVLKKLEDLKVGERQTNYRLRDWGVSRQRYWGCPIPILYLEDGSVVPVPEDQLPVKLPHDVEFNGEGNPLENHPTWKHTTYKGQKAIRETDTFDTFFESSWYFLRFASQTPDKAFDSQEVNNLLPVDQYVGGIEHAVLHLLYARFFTKALKKCGYLNFDEPFKNLLTQGMVCHPTFKDQYGAWVMPCDVMKEKDGNYVNINTKQEVLIGRSEKMSKSKKNVIEPINIVDAYGADTARLFMLSDSPPEKNLEWSDSGIDGSWKYVNRLWKMIAEFCLDKDISQFQSIEFFNQNQLKGLSETQLEIIKLNHKSISSIKEEFSQTSFNRAIAKIREFSNGLDKFTIKDSVDQKIMYYSLKNLTLLISPIAPHLAEELWNKLGEETEICEALFPKFNPELTIDNTIKIALQLNGKLKIVLEMPKDLDKEEIKRIAFENQAVQKILLNKEIKKTIIVPNKIINIVA